MSDSIKVGEGVGVIVSVEVEVCVGVGVIILVAVAVRLGVIDGKGVRVPVAVLVKVDALSVGVEPEKFVFHKPDCWQGGNETGFRMVHTPEADVGEVKLPVTESEVLVNSNRPFGSIVAPMLSTKTLAKPHALPVQLKSYAKSLITVKLIVLPRQGPGNGMGVVVRLGVTCKAGRASVEVVSSHKANDKKVAMVTQSRTRRGMRSPCVFDRSVTPNSLFGELAIVVKAIISSAPPCQQTERPKRARGLKLWKHCVDKGVSGVYNGFRNNKLNDQEWRDNMVSDKIGLELHDKATRDVPLTEIEREQLEAWYRLQDEKDMSRLGLNHPDTTIEELKRQVDQTIMEIKSLAEQIQNLTASNEALRHDLAVLRLQVAQRVPMQPV